MTERRSTTLEMPISHSTYDALVGRHPERADRLADPTAEEIRAAVAAVARHDVEFAIVAVGDEYCQTAPHAADRLLLEYSPGRVDDMEETPGPLPPEVVADALVAFATGDLSWRVGLPWVPLGDVRAPVATEAPPRGRRWPGRRR